MDTIARCCGCGTRVESTSSEVHLYVPENLLENVEGSNGDSDEELTSPQKALAAESGLASGGLCLPQEEWRNGRRRSSVRGELRQKYLESSAFQPLKDSFRWANRQYSMTSSVASYSGEEISVAIRAAIQVRVNALPTRTLSEDFTELTGQAVLSHSVSFFFWSSA